MLKSWLLRCSLIFFSSYLSLAYAYSEQPTKNDPLQVYRDEIQQSETKASQSVLDALKANTSPDNSSQQNQPAAKSSAVPPAPRSNNDKAFMSPTDNNSTNSARSSNKNPWLKPNPWANQPPNIWEKNAKINPYSNAPIPGPTPSTNLTTPSPPNIFAPSRSTPNTNNPQTNGNS